MCDTCGCNVTPGNVKFAYKPVEPGATTISVLQGLLKKNDDQADHNRAHFDARGILAVNLMSSPGSGKTALLEATIKALKSEFNIAVIEGDLETENDADRIRAQGVPAHQIVTGTACHLDAHMVHDALHHMDLAGIDLLFVENVGNLVCPASFDLGQHANVALLSTTEGDDKPAKYPVMFRGADAVVISKTDLLAVLDDFSPDKAERHVRELANPAPVLRLSARKGDGMDAWLGWLREQLAGQRARVAAGATRRPAIQPEGALMHGAQG
ncbi:MAG: hydrogenase nickel incorporation protein HypB [Thiobacillus sp.]|nr:hydrogenase nickel incorporation protein HypB [Thiobacillus sp.]